MVELCKICSQLEVKFNGLTVDSSGIEGLLHGSVVVSALVATVDRVEHPEADEQAQNCLRTALPCHDLVRNLNSQHRERKKRKIKFRSLAPCLTSFCSILRHERQVEKC